MGAAERVRPQAAVTITGLSLRTVQALALRGEIPGAAKLGGSWTFDEAALRNWIKERIQWPKDQKPLNTPIGGAAPYGRGSPLADVNIEKAFAQARSRLRGRA